MEGFCPQQRVDLRDELGRRDGLGVEFKVMALFADLSQQIFDACVC